MSDVLMEPTRKGFGRGLLAAGHAYPNVVAACADLTESTQMHLFAETFPESAIMRPFRFNGYYDESEAPDVDEVLIRAVPFPGKTGKKEFLFLFDYGDEWHFGVKLLGTSEKKTPRARYPRVTAKRGKAPPQYPSWDDEDDEDWDEDEEGEEGAWDDGEGGFPQTITFRLDPKTGQPIIESIILTPPKKPTSS